MPIFEYTCRLCGHRFDALVLRHTKPVCPRCAGEDLERLISVPAVHSEGTHQLALKAAKQRDKKLARENARAQREYELHHND